MRCEELKIKSESTPDTNLHLNKWSSDSETHDFTILAIHGYGEHSESWRGIATFLTEKFNCEVWAYDQQFHGKSKVENQIDPPHIDNFDDMASDLLQIADKIRSDSPERKIFLMFHSMGATITLIACLKNLERFKALKIAGAIGEGSNIQVHPNLAKWYFRMIAKFMGTWLPKMKAPISIPISDVTSDVQAQENFKNDPLCFQGVRNKLGMEVTLIEVYFKENIKNWPSDVPCSLHHGTNDLICDIQGSQFWYDNVKSNKNSEYFSYENEKHRLKESLPENKDKFFQNVHNFIAKILEK